jgi:hypothetical protein
LCLRVLQFAPELRALNLRVDHNSEEPLLNLAIPLAYSNCQVRTITLVNDNFHEPWLEFFEKQNKVKYLSLDFDIDGECDGSHR